MTQYTQTKTANWRQVVKSNQRRTLFVLLSFLGIYSILGLLFDLYLYQDTELHPTFLIGFFVLALIVLGLGMLFGNRASLAGTNARQLSSEEKDPKLKQLYNIVEEMKIAASLRYMPKVYILNVSYMNAFACGWNEKNACVAISRPLLEALTRDELQAVMAHELTHVRNQDTRLLLAVSVMSNFSIFLIDILFRSTLHSKARKSKSSNSRSSGVPIELVILALRIILPILTAVLLFYLSRKREFMADAGGVELTRDNRSMANALIKIHKAHKSHKEEYQHAYHNTDHESMRSLSYLYDPRTCGIRNHLNINELFSTHPPLEKRLEALGYTKLEAKGQV